MSRKRTGRVSLSVEEVEGEEDVWLVVLVPLGWEVVVMVVAEQVTLLP